jgi:hypothetical protein
MTTTAPLRPAPAVPSAHRDAVVTYYVGNGDGWELSGYDAQGFAYLARPCERVTIGLSGSTYRARI